MIYLIISRGEDYLEGKGNIKTYYKIGYTRDNNFERRLENYYLHNPFCKILCTIPNGTARHESLIHNRFRNLRAYRREWFEDDNNSIINFFNTYKTVDDLNNVLGVGDPKYFVKDATGKLTEEFQNLRSYIKNCLNIFYNKKITSLNLITTIDSELTRCVRYYVGEIGKSIFTEDDFLDKFEEDRSESIREVIEKNEKLLEKPILDFIEDFNSLSDFRSKMKALCESGFSEYEMSAILDQVPLTYKKYYLVLGPERCKAHGYIVTNIRREYEDTIMDKGEMKSEIHRTFEVGKVYSNKDVKSKLTEIYNSYGYNKIPKANDLEGYFKVVRATKTVEGKRVEGVRILEKL